MLQPYPTVTPPRTLMGCRQGYRQAMPRSLRNAARCPAVTAKRPVLVLVLAEMAERPIHDPSESGCQEPFEERTVALEGVAEVVGGDVVTAIPMALQPSPLIREGAGQMLHELGDQGVGLLDSPPGRVDKAGLDVGPAGPEPLGGLAGQQRAGRGRGPPGAVVGAGLRFLASEVVGAGLRFLANELVVAAVAPLDV